jgi:hypothetical protein
MRWLRRLPRWRRVRRLPGLRRWRRLQRLRRWRVRWLPRLRRRRMRRRRLRVRWHLVRWLRGLRGLCGLRGLRGLLPILGIVPFVLSPRPNGRHHQARSPHERSDMRGSGLVPGCRFAHPGYACSPSSRRKPGPITTGFSDFAKLDLQLSQNLDWWLWVPAQGRDDDCRESALFRRDLPRRRRRTHEIGGQLRVARFRVLHGFLLHRSVAADAIR